MCSWLVILQVKKGSGQLYSEGTKLAPQYSSGKANMTLQNEESNYRKKGGKAATIKSFWSFYNVLLWLVDSTDLGLKSC